MAHTSEEVDVFDERGGDLFFEVFTVFRRAVDFERSEDGAIGGVDDAGGHSDQRTDLLDAAVDHVASVSFAQGHRDAVHCLKLVYDRPSHRGLERRVSTFAVQIREW